VLLTLSGLIADEASLTGLNVFMLILNGETMMTWTRW